MDLVTIYGEWDNIEGITDSDGNVKNNLSIKFTPEMVLKIFKRISDEDVNFMI